ncbi:transcription termination factor Rho [Haemophilus influenzae 22.1-21]|nr:transcription termination factor Rho [Haemophilus influenzae 22.1-21]
MNETNNTANLEKRFYINRANDCDCNYCYFSHHRNSLLSTLSKKAAVSELLQASAPYKADVELCVYSTGKPSSCSGGSNGIAADITTAKGYVKSVTTSNGEITVAGNGTLDGMSYTLTAEGDSAKGVTWKTTCGTTNADIFPAGFCSK